MNITQFEKYVEGCLITWNHGEWNSELVNLTLGYGGEFGEFNYSLALENREQVVDEAGDFLYYTTVLLYKLNEYKLKQLDINIPKTTVEHTVAEMIMEYRFPRFQTKDYDSVVTEVRFAHVQKAVGIVLERTKKYTFHGKPLHEEQITEALLQTLSWLYRTLAHKNIELIDVMQHNFEKLSKRYPEGFKKLAEKYNS